MKVIQVVARSVSSEAIALVERAFHQAGLETLLFVFGIDAERNAAVAVELAEGQTRDVHPRQVWIVPSSFVEIERSSEWRAVAARRLAGIPPRDGGQQRLLISLTEGSMQPTPGTDIINLKDLASGAITGADLRAIFAEPD